MLDESPKSWHGGLSSRIGFQTKELRLSHTPTGLCQARRLARQYRLKVGEQRNTCIRCLNKNRLKSNLVCCSNDMVALKLVHNPPLELRLISVQVGRSLNICTAHASMQSEHGVSSANCTQKDRVDKRKQGA